GLKEEPDFKFKTMVIRVLWPGATASEIEQQVTDKLEKKLQDTPKLDYLRSYSRPGESVIFLNLEGDTRAQQVDATWYQVRKKLATLGVEPGQLLAVLAAQNAVAPAGRVVGADSNLQVRVTGSFDSVAAIEAASVRINGQTLRVGDVAKVSRGYADPPSSKMR